MINFIYGLCIGLGFIIPGVSGGVIATILGIYEKIINSILNFKDNIKENSLFLLPIFGGILLSIFLFSNILLYLINNKYFYISYVFMGLILGTIPYLLKEIKRKEDKNIQFLPFFITLIIGLLLYIIDINNYSNHSTLNILTIILAGFFYAFGKIVPGISSSALLMLLGLYEYFLNIIANPLHISISTFIYIIIFIISFIISAIIILKVISYLLKYHYRSTYSAIIGFVITSILFLYPGTFNYLSIIILILAFNISYLLSN